MVVGKSRLNGIKIYDHEKAFENAIKKGMTNPDEWMYMYSTRFKDYFKNCCSRGYKSYFNIKNLFQQHLHDNQIIIDNVKETEFKLQQDERSNNTIYTAGCECGNADHEKVWDEQLGAYYHTYECKKCNYYWEGPIYDGSSPNDDLEESRPYISSKELNFKAKENDNEFELER